MNGFILHLTPFILRTPKDSMNASWEKEPCCCQGALTSPTKNRSTHTHTYTHTQTHTHTKHCNSCCLFKRPLSYWEPVILKENQRHTLSVPKSQEKVTWLNSTNSKNSQRRLLTVCKPEKYPHTVQFSGV